MPRARIILGAALIGLATIGGSSNGRPLDPLQEARVRPSGKPVNCLSLAQISETRVRDDQTIDFITTSGQVYRNHLPNSCPGLGFEEKFSHTSSLTEICSSDIITVLTGQPGVGASCGLGQFQPVTGVPR